MRDRYFTKNAGSGWEPKHIGKFDTIEGFWKFYNHLVRPNDLPVNVVFFLR